MNTRADELEAEKKTLRAMIEIFCKGNHQGKGGLLCDSCRQLLSYAEARLDACPFGPTKGPCSQCTIHCYKPEMQAQITSVMRYAGPRMPRRHPIMALMHMLKCLKNRISPPKRHS